MATKTKPTVKTVPVTSTKAAKVVRTSTVVAADKPVPKAKASPKAKNSAKGSNNTGAEQRRHYVEVAAFFIAERRGFAPGDLMADWLAAERQVDGLIAEGKIGA